MKKLLFTFLALMVLGTTAWAAGTTTTLERGKYKLVATTTQVATEIGWTSKAKTAFNINTDIAFAGFGANATLQTQTDQSKGARIYESQNNLGASSINVKNGWIESVCLDYNIAAENGVLCTDASDVNPVPTDKRYVSGTTYTVNGTSFSFYAGRTKSSTAASPNGRCDITKWTVTYYRTPTTVDLATSMTVEPNSVFKIGQIIPYDTYQTWSTTDASKVSVDQNGVITAKAEGSATIKVTFADGTSKSCEVTVETSSDQSVVETFKNATFASSSSSNNVDGVLATWEYVYIRRDLNDTPADKLRNGENASRFHNKTNAHYTTTAALEGGIKRISFCWNNSSPFNENAHNFTVSAGTVSDNVVKTVVVETKNDRLSVADLLYTHDFEVKENVTLSITNNQTARYLLIGNIKVTPYLLYTTKSAEATGSYKNESLINNTGATPTFSLEDNDGEASIAADGTVTCLKEGLVTVKASWNNGKVYTTYSLTTHVKPTPTASFEAETVNKDLLAGAFINTFTKQEGSGNVTYESSRPDIASIAADGTVTILMNGTTTITANVAENDDFAAVSKSYTLNVGYTPVATQVFKETFDSCGQKGSTSVATQVVGDSGIYNWEFNVFQRLSGAKNDEIAGEQGTRVRYVGGYIKMVGNQEGGIKAVAFKWHPTNNGTPQLKVKVGSKEYMIENKEVLYSSGVYQFARNFDVNSNTQLIISNEGTSGAGSPYVVVSPVTITPYLLYTVKTADMNALDGAYTHPIINNTNGEGTITYSLEGEGADQIASINDQGAVTAKKDGQVTVKATWGDVTTTYTLNVHMANTGAKFDAAVVKKEIGDDAFTNALTKATSGAASYSSNNESVATVNATSGEVTIMNGGTAQIKAVIAADGAYRDTTLFYTLDVEHTPAEGTFFKETLSSSDNTFTQTPLQEFAGDSGVFVWEIQNTRRWKENATKPADVDLVDGVPGSRIRYNGFLRSKGVQEGGVKEIAFDWRVTDGKLVVDYAVAAGEDTLQYARVGLGTSATQHFGHIFEIKENTSWSISLTAQKDPQQSYIIAGPIKIVPYLLYTIKSAEWKQKDGKFTNTALINNTTGDPVVYSLEDNDGEASIDAATGEVTILGEGEVTVKATWGNVYTTYNLITHVKPIPTASFEEETVNKDLLAGAFINTFTKQEGSGNVTYESSNTDIATVAADGTVTLIMNGTTTITANVAENDDFAAVSKSYTLNVGYTPVEGKFWPESFTQCPNEGGTGKSAKADVPGDNNVYNWYFTYFMRRTDGTDDKNNGVQGVRVRYGGSIANKGGKLEGGIKAVSFDWRTTSASNLVDFKVNLGEETYHYQSAAVASNVVNSYARKSEVKKNTDFSISLDSAKQAFIVVSSLKITPYLLYTCKDTTVYAKNCTNYKNFTNDMLINNIDEGEVTYSVPENNGVVSIDAASGEVTILGEGQTTVTATWGEVSTTYQLTVKLEDAELEFAKSSDLVYLNQATEYTQTASKSTTAAVKYEFASEHGDATIDETSGKVTFNGQTGTFTIQASVAQVLPYKLDTTSYELTVTKAQPEFGYAVKALEKTMNDAAFTNPLTRPEEGIGAITYESSDKAIAKVDNQGQVTIFGAGEVTITASMAEGTQWGQATDSYTLNVTDPMESAVVEDLKDAKFGAETIPHTIEGALANWEYQYVRRRYSGNNDFDTLQTGAHATWFNYDAKAHLITSDKMEGGIKRVSFLWNRTSNNNRVVEFVVSAGAELQTKDTIIMTTSGSVARYVPDFVYNHNFSVKENAKFAISRMGTPAVGSPSYMVVGDIKITPYLLFKGTKVVDVDLDDVTEFNLNDTIINNIDEGIVTFAVDSFKTDVAPAINAGVLDFTNVKKGGKVYVSAKWEDVVTTLVINTIITPAVSFAETTVNKNLDDAAFTNTFNAPEGVGAITYSSLNTNVATVDANGLVTIKSSGSATIKAVVAANDSYKATSATYELTVAGYTPVAGEAWVETFSRLSKTDGYVDKEQKFQGDSLIFGWKIDEYIRDAKDKPFRLRENGYIATNGRQEGGIKYAALNWKPSANGNIDFTMKVNSASYQYKGAVTKDQPYCFEHFFNADSICPLEIKMGSEGITAYMSVVNVTVVPYLLYTKKQVTLDMKSSHTYQMVPQIDNRDNEVAIQYSFKDGDVDFATIDPATGVVTATAGGEVTVKAAWGKVWTSYKLTILNDKSTIYLMRNDDTELADTIVNNCGEAMPLIAQPTREGYRFNAYFTSPDTSVTPGYRFTVTRLDSKTVWVAKRKIGNDSIINYDRKWIYQGATYTFYAQWMPEVTITLDNQGAIIPGTDKVMTANCPNNNSVNLSEDITVPAIDGLTFMGYFTQEKGQGVQLIDKKGAFIANVAGYTNEYKMWQKVEGATLYAHWAKIQQEVTDTIGSSEIDNWANVTVENGGNLVMNEEKVLDTLCINDGGQVTAAATLTVQDLVIKASASATGTSGQITGATDANLEIKGDAYFDLTLAKNGTADQWHAFTVPFQVDMINGIYDLDGNKLTNEVNYAIMVYQGDVRAQGKYGWIKVHKTGNTILQPGTFYIMATDGERATYRMKMYGAFSVASENLTVHEYAKSGEGEDTDAGWNGIGNSQLDYRMVDGNVQVLDPESYSFMTFTAKDTMFAVGTPFFYQAATEGTIVLEKEAQAAPMRAVNKELKNIAVIMANEDYTDRLYISATSEATEAYQIGKDMSKMSMTSTPAVPQICAQAYGTKLSMIDLPMDNEEVTYDLSLYAPKAGEYTIAAASVENATIYLYEDGSLVWNLSMGACTVDMAKGNNGAYSLVMKLNKTDVITGADAANAQKDGIQKFIYNDQLIIIRDGKAYNGVGALLK